MISHKGKDRNGLTVLHVAVAEEVSQTLQILLSRWSFKEGVN